MVMVFVLKYILIFYMAASIKINTYWFLLFFEFVNGIFKKFQ